MSEEGYSVTDDGQPMPLEEFSSYFRGHLPQAFRVDTAPNRLNPEMTEG